MCGINGIIGEQREIVEAMNARTTHRGPDQEGVSSGAGSTIGNNRLAILDLSEAGRQPIQSANGRYTIVFNGEIYNFRVLRSALEAQGIRFRGGSDTEVLVEGFAVWGDALFDRLRGMWALCIRDNETGALTLARDPFGIKPLYLYNDGKTVAFSSELKGLRAVPNISQELDTQAIQDLLLLGYVLAPRTIFRHARSLLPGEIITLKREGTTASRRMMQLAVDPPALSEPPSDASLLTVLEDSVRHHLIADVPVGLFFSGGIDSSTLALVLQRIGTTLTTYHVALEDRPDTAYAREIAKRLSITLVEIPFAATDVPHVLERFWQAMDQPFADASFLPSLIVAERAVQDVKVVLAGEGGDELFSGYPRHLRMAGAAADARRSEQDGLATFFRVVLRSLPQSIALLPHAQGLLRRRAPRCGLAEAFLAGTGVAFGLMSTAAAAETIRGRMAEREQPDGLLAADRLIYLPDDLLAKTDVASMAFSLEARVPFLDREVFRAVAAAPLAWKRAGGVSKAPLRRLLKQSLPASLIDRPKAGFSVSLSRYLLAYHRKELPDVFSWYLRTHKGLAPTLDTVLGWATKKQSNMGRVLHTLGYTSFALLTLYRFEERLRKE